MASALASPRPLAIDLQLGGQAPCYLVWLAALSVARGRPEVVVVYRALNGRSGARVGTMQFAGMGAQYRYPIGYDAYLMYVAMWAQRFLNETGQGPEDLGAVAVSQRRYGGTTGARYGANHSELDAYLAEPFVVDPYRRPDCTVEVDGSVRRRGDLAGTGAATWPTPGCRGVGLLPGRTRGPVSTSATTYCGRTTAANYTSWLRDELFGRAGIGQGDVDVAEIYDCFTSTVLMGLEGLGPVRTGRREPSCVRAHAGSTGAFRRTREAGCSAEGYLHGMNTVAEAVLQVQGRGGTRQAPRHEVAVVTSGALMDGSALILTADR